MGCKIANHNNVKLLPSRVLPQRLSFKGIFPSEQGKTYISNDEKAKTEICAEDGRDLRALRIVSRRSSWYLPQFHHMRENLPINCPETSTILALLSSLSKQLPEIKLSIQAHVTFEEGWSLSRFLAHDFLSLVCYVFSRTGTSSLK